MTAEEKFKTGDQVHRSVAGYKAGVQGRYGTIVGFGPKPELIRVKIAYTRRKGTGTYHMDFWNKVLKLPENELPAGFGED